VVNVESIQKTKYIDSVARIVIWQNCRDYQLSKYCP
jgi:hypothetical protein